IPPCFTPRPQPLVIPFLLFGVHFRLTGVAADPRLSFASEFNTASPTVDGLDYNLGPNPGFRRQDVRVMKFVLSHEGNPPSGRMSLRRSLRIAPQKVFTLESPSRRSGSS